MLAIKGMYDVGTWWNEFLFQGDAESVERAARTWPHARSKQVCTNASPKHRQT